MKRKWLWFFIALIVSFFILASFFAGRQLSLELLKEYRSSLLLMVHANFAVSAIIYFVLYVAAVVSNLPLVAFMTLSGGMLFGIPWAVALVVTAATIGSILTFFIVRYMVGDRFRVQYATSLPVFYEHMKRYGAWYLLVIHFVTVIPLSLINIFAALSPVSWWTFAWTTVLGVLPIALVYAFAGQYLNTINTIYDLLSIRVFLIIATLIVLSLLPIIFSRKTSFQKRR